ncbi:serine rich protein interaction domain-containing protein [Ditylenchus destructor]|uniref:Serine rich protein interaction domain-containing protein n=1 Tax=Ditylenchus destructor TaxID=166010 RepID=A0AAD4R8S0_9BILA|nr:serine rich protein interaction domain-containing protein [Ditylenchus destructor]
MSSSSSGTISDSTPFGSTPCLAALPERVSELFMLDNNFFRSPFMRDKIVVPNLLFSNGTNGLESTFSPTSSSGNQQQVPTSISTSVNSSSPMFHSGNATGNRLGSTHTLFDDVHVVPPSISGPRRFSAGNGLGQPGAESGDANFGVVRNIPIRVIGENSNAHKISAGSANDSYLRSNGPNFPTEFSNRNRDQQQEDSVSLRSAPPEFWHNQQQLQKEVDTSRDQKNTSNRVIFDSNQQESSESEAEMSARRKLSAPREFPSADRSNTTFARSTPASVRTVVNFRTVPILQLNPQRNNTPREQVFSAGATLSDQNSNNTSISDWIQRRERASTPTNVYTSPLSPTNDNGDNSKPYYSAIPFRRSASTVPTGTGSMTSAISTPSLLQSSPAFLRRTQTAHNIPPVQLPRRDSEPSIAFEANSNDSEHQANRHSLHENSINPGTQNGQTTTVPSRSKSPSMSSLKHSIKSSLSSKPAKKISFVPLSCVRKNPGSDASDDDNVNLPINKQLNRSRSPSLTASSLRLTEFVPQDQNGQNRTHSEDPVEEAIRSLEAFDPNDYIKQNQPQRQVNSGSVTQFSGTQQHRPLLYASSDDDSLPPPPPQLSSSSLTPSLSSNTSGIGTGTDSAPNNRGSERVIGGQTRNNQNHRDSALSNLSSSSTNTTSSSAPDSTFPSKEIPLPATAYRVQPNTQPPLNRYGTNSSVGDSINVRRPSVSTINTIHSSGSVTPTGPPPTDSIFNRSFENRTPRATTPTSTLNYTNMGNNASAAYNPVYKQQNNRDFPRHSSTNQQNNASSPRAQAPFEVDQLLSRLKADRGLTNNQTGSQPPYCSPDYDDEDCEAAAEAEAHLRKRFLCTQLTDCVKVIEINALKMSQFAAAGGGGWREAHILRHNLAAIRDTVYTIEFALEELVDALVRISVDRNNPKASEFRQLSAPLLASQSLIRRLRANLDATGWSLQALSRPATNNSGNDALDQFVAVLRQLPRDCYKLVQWVYLLEVWNGDGSGTATFLPSSSHAAPPSPAPVPYTMPYSRSKPYNTSSNNVRNSSSSSASDEPSSPRNSGYNSSNSPQSRYSQPSNYRPANHSTSPVFNNQIHSIPRIGMKSPSNVDPPRRPPDTSRFTENTTPTSAEVMDGGESTTSSAASSTTMDDLVSQSQATTQNSKPPITTNTSAEEKPLKLQSRDEISPKQTVSQPSQDHEEDDGEPPSRVYEEDDLMSVASESVDSLYGDYSFVNASRSPPSDTINRAKYPDRVQNNRNISFASPIQQRRNLHARNGDKPPSGRNAIGILSEEEKELLRFYQPQIDSNIAELCRLVDEFFTVVEKNSQSAKTFVQKIQMICIKVQTLVCIARMVAKDDITKVSPELKSTLEKEANKLDGLLNECVGSARIAKDKTQNVQAVQAMVFSVSEVSQAALNLKAFWKTNAGGSKS